MATLLRMVRWRQAVRPVFRQRALNGAIRAAIETLPSARRDSVRAHMPTYGWVPVRHPSKRLRFWTEDDDTLTWDLYKDGLAGYEPGTMPVALALAQRCSTIVDVGAHVGIFTLAMAAVNDQASVYAFEPVGAVFERLMRNVVGNALPGVVCVNAAVAAASGTMPIFSPAGELSTVASSEPAHRMSARDRPYRCDIVASIRLEEFLPSCGIEAVDLVKIDVEQAELDVLVGMGSLLDRHPHVICEVFPEEWTSTARADALRRLIAGTSYRVYLLTPDGPVERRDVTGDAQHWNQLFTVAEPGEVASLHQLGVGLLATSADQLRARRRKPWADKGASERGAGPTPRESTEYCQPGL